MADDPKLETLPEIMIALVAILADLKSLTAVMQKAATAAAKIDHATFAYCHRLRQVLLDMTHQFETMELPPQFRAVAKGESK
jgi:hypothetical protein